MEMTPELSNLIGMAFLLGMVLTVVSSAIFNWLADMAIALVERRKRGAEVPS